MKYAYLSIVSIATLTRLLCVATILQSLTIFIAHAETLNWVGGVGNGWYNTQVTPSFPFDFYRTNWLDFNTLSPFYPGSGDDVIFGNDAAPAININPPILNFTSVNALNVNADNPVTFIGDALHLNTITARNASHVFNIPVKLLNNSNFNVFTDASVDFNQPLTSDFSFLHNNHGTININHSADMTYITFGGGTLNLNPGSITNVNVLTVALNTSPSPSINVIGPGTQLNITSIANIYSTANTPFVVSEGATMTTYRITIVGHHITSPNGNLAITDPGTTLDAGGLFSIGITGTATVSVLNGATINAVDTDMSVTTNSTGILNISGEGSTFNADHLQVGDIVETPEGFVATNATVNVDAGGTLNINNSLGITTNNHININDGTINFNASARIDQVKLNQGQLSASGGNTIIRTASAYSPGQQGHIRIGISNGATFANLTTFQLGANANTTTEMNIVGSGSSWVARGFINIGGNAPATVNVTDNASILKSSASFITINPNGHLLLNNATVDTTQFQTAGQMTIQLPTVDDNILSSHISFNQPQYNTDSTIAGNLTIDLMNQTLPEPGTQFDIFDYDTLSGDFDSVTTINAPAGLYFDFTYGAGTGTITATAHFEGDANLDGIVDLEDLAKLATNFGQSGNWFTGDFTNDNMVDLADLAKLATNFGQSITPPLTPPLASNLSATVSIPEPSSLLLMLSSVLFCFKRKQV